MKFSKRQRVLNSSNLLPVTIVDDTYLRVTYRRNQAAAYLAPEVEFDAHLVGPWTSAQQGVNGVEIIVTNEGFGASIDRIEVLIPRTNEIDGKLFARLKVSEP